MTHKTQSFSLAENLHGVLFFASMVLWAAVYFWRIDSIRPDFISSDYLYPFLINLSDFINFRSPPSGYFFPDVLLEKIFQVFLKDAYRATLHAGYLQLIVLGALLAVRSGGIYAAITLSVCILLSVEDSLLIANHLSLVVLFYLTLVVGPRYSGLLGVILDLSDPLLIVPQSLLMLSTEIKGTKSSCINIGSIFFGWLIVFVYSETNKQLIMLFPFVFLFLSCIYLIRRFGLGRLSIDLGSYQITALLLLGAAIAFIVIHQPVRYANALICCACLAFQWDSPVRPTRVKQALSLSLLTLIIVSVNNERVETMISRANVRYDCLAEALRERKIITIGVDYWVSKPLFLAQDAGLNMVVIDYERWESFPWISPLKWGAGTTRYFIQSISCSSGDRHCSQRHIHKYSESSELLCDSFVLYKTREEINFDGAKDKLDSLQKTISRNFQKFSELF